MESLELRPGLVQGGSESQSQITGSGAGGPAGQTLLDPYRGRLCGLDQAVHFLSCQAASKGDGCAGGAGVSVGSGGEGRSVGLDAEPGAQRAGLPLQRSAPPGTGLDERAGAGETPEADADRDEQKGGAPGVGS